MIEIKEIENLVEVLIPDEFGDLEIVQETKSEHKLFIDNQLIYGVSIFKGYGYWMVIYDYSDSFSQKIFKVNLQEYINNEISNIKLKFYWIKLEDKFTTYSDDELLEDFFQKKISCVIRLHELLDSRVEREISFQMSFELLKWKLSFTIDDYAKQFRKEIKELDYIEGSVGRVLRNKNIITIKLPINSLVNSLDSEISKGIDILNELHINTIKSLSVKKLSGISFQEFDFPPNVRTACEQYLQYFVDFLKDVGVKATADIQHNKFGKTLFKIYPENPNIALDAIREALEIYLELPINPLIDESDISDSRMLSLQAEINTLKSRLNIAQIKQIESEKRIELQTELISTQRELIEERNNRVNILEQRSLNEFEPTIVSESLKRYEIIEGEIINEEVKSDLDISNKDIDLGLVTIKQAKIGLGVEANTPRLTRLGIKKGKQLFDYLDKKFNSEEK